MNVKVSDFVFEYIANLGVKHIFYLPGGGAMHLDDSLGHNEKLIPVCMLHEQPCSIAAEAYARISGNFGVCVVTSGPGATNTITGLAGHGLIQHQLFLFRDRQKEQIWSVIRKSGNLVFRKLMLLNL